MGERGRGTGSSLSGVCHGSTILLHIIMSPLQPPIYSTYLPLHCNIFRRQTGWGFRWDQGIVGILGDSGGFGGIQGLGSLGGYREDFEHWVDWGNWVLVNWGNGLLGATLSIALGKKTCTLHHCLMSCSQRPGARPGTTEDQLYPGQLSHKRSSFLYGSHHCVYSYFYVLLCRQYIFQFLKNRPSGPILSIS